MTKKELYEYALRGILQEWGKIKREDYKTKEDWCKANDELKNKFNEVALMLSRENDK